MNRKEAVALTRLVAAACPQQAIDSYTPDVWYDLLDDLSFDDCREAVRVIGRQRPFMAPAEIRAEVKRIRSDRVARTVIPAPPPELADDPEAYRKALAESVRLAADGELPPAQDVPAAIGPPPGQRTGGPPASLRETVRDLRRQMGTARARSATESTEAIAARQAAEYREAEDVRNEAEEAS
jgi:hypothetical protein